MKRKLDSTLLGSPCPSQENGQSQQSDLTNTFLQALNALQPPIENTEQKEAQSPVIHWPEVRQAQNTGQSATRQIDRPTRKRSFPSYPNQGSPYSPFISVYPINPYPRTAQEILQDKYLVRLKVSLK